MLPELDDEKFMALVEHLSSELGVTKKEDLALVEPNDLLQHLKTNTASQVHSGLQTNR